MQALKQVTLFGYMVATTTAAMFAQDFSAQAAAAAAPVASVYVQTHSGVNVYSANAAGQLTLLAGSPFATAGQMEGLNSKYLISVGTDNLHVYPVAASGALGKQTSQISTQSYSGSKCGTTDTAIHVYTVTSTSITPVSGSPFKATGAYGLKGLMVRPM